MLKKLLAALEKELADKSGSYDGTFTPWHELSDEEKGASHTDDKVLADANRDNQKAQKARKGIFTKWG